MKKYLIRTIEFLVAAMPCVFMLLVLDGRLAINEPGAVVGGYFLLLTASILSIWAEDNGRKKKDV